jgi:hypothetical protein
LRPDFIMFADTGSEKSSTYAYIPVIRCWLGDIGFPDITVARYRPRHAPYKTLEGNMLKNATLPGATFGMSSCTLKFKIEPQNRACRDLACCQAAWAAGGKVTKMIGFESGEEYRKLRASDKAHTAVDPRYEYEYPLIEWGWTRERCKAEIESAGLPVPPKSACVFCPNVQPDELLDMTEDERGRIARIELQAEPYNKKVHGLWRRGRKSDNRPGSITRYMIQRGIPFTHPKTLGLVPLNPKSGKAVRGHTFQGPHDAPSIAADLNTLPCTPIENAQHRALIEAL